MTLRLGGDGAITGCTSLENPDLTVSGLTISGSFDAEKVLVASGTAAAPSYTFSGDTDNGLYYAGTNSIGVSTAGTSAIVVDASQNVGIGTTSADANLHIKGSYPTVHIERDSATNYSRLLLDNTANDGGAIDGIGDGVGGLRFATSDAGTITERMRIDSSGNVGIGASSPGSILTVQASGTQQALFSARANAGAGGGMTLQTDASDDGLLRLYDSAGAVKVQLDTDGGNNYIAQGNVGIGTTSPARRLSVQNSAVDTEGIALYRNTGDGTLMAGLAQDADGHGEIRVNNTSGTRNVQIRGNGISYFNGGNVGIGTTSPARNLHINGADSDTVQIHLTNSTTGGGANDGFSLVLGSDESAILNMRESNPMRFLTSDTERMRIDSSGRLLVGLTDGTGVKLHVANGNAQQAGVQKDCARFIASTAAPTNSGGLTIGAVWHNTDVNQRISYLQSEQGRDPGSTARNLALNPDGGSVLIGGTTTSTASIHLNYNGSANFYSASNNISITSNRTSGTTFAFISGRGDSGSDLNLIIWNNGNIQNANNSYGAISDAKLKENIVDASSQWDDIKDLRVRNYNFIEGQTHTQIGVVAQEVETVSPGLVTESPDRDEEGNDLGTTTKSVNYSVLYMKAVKALQEAMDRIETLEAKVAALEESQSLTLLNT